MRMASFYAVVRVVTECCDDFLGISEFESESKPESYAEVSTKADIFVDWFDSRSDAVEFAQEYIDSR